MVTEYAFQFTFKASNNQAEYEALIAGLRITKDLSVKWLKVFIDLQLVVGQSQGKYEVRDPVLLRYLQKLRSLQANFDYFKIFHIPRSKNVWADSLSQLMIFDCSELEKIFIEHLDNLSINTEKEVHQIQVDHEPSWIDPFIEYLIDRTLPINHV